MIVAVGCSESFDDSLIWEEINSLKDRVTTLEQLCKQMNTNISSLQTIVTALQNNDYVTNISPITEDGKTIGYTITFSKSGSVTIYHGKDGKDGYTPVIGVAKDVDGLYYWTLDGEWLLDNGGNKVKAQGVDGKDGVDGADGKDGVNGTDGKDGVNGTDGKDSVTPKLKIENGYWYISYDNGSSWTQLDKATGENGQDGTNGKDGVDGDSMFKSVIYDNNYIYITLSDDSVIIISRNIMPQNQIWYTTTDGELIEVSFASNNIVSHIYENGKGVITFSNNLTEIPASAFNSKATLASVTLPESITTLGSNAFSVCENLANIVLPKSLTTIGFAAFGGCTKLQNITLPDSVTKIEEMAFTSGGLKTITIPAGVIMIHPSTFRSCI